MRALVVVCRYLGDVLLATPLARSLLHAGYEVDWLVAPGTDVIIQNQTFAKQIYILHPSVNGTLEAIRILYGTYDIACVVNGADRPMLVSLLAAKKVYALVPSRSQDAWKRWFSTNYITNTAHDHMVHYALDLAELIGITPSYKLGLEWTDHDVSSVSNAVSEKIRRRFVHLHPFARWRYKYWPDQHWKELAERLLAHGINLVITAGPHERKKAEELMHGLDQQRIMILAGELTWAQLACLTSQSLAYVGLDTANTHLAASTGTPTIALFGPTNPELWGPWPYEYSKKNPYQACSPTGIQRAGNVILLQGKESCVPCQLEGCERNGDSSSRCLETMSTEFVWQKLTPLLGSVA